MRRALPKADSAYGKLEDEEEFFDGLIRVSYINLSDLLHCLIECSEKAARIARTFRAQDELFQLLVEEKSEIQKNHKKVQDFKTLADVLIQETIKRDVGRKFSILRDRVQGEEQNTFENTLGESIKVELNDSVQNTTELLCKVLNGRVDIAESLAEIVHADDVNIPKEYISDTRIEESAYGIWIDPIDSTAEYIQAKENMVDEHGIDLCGLKCVCILIGVYDMSTGSPVIGVINQPFHTETDNPSKWKSNFYWGISYGTENLLSASLYSRPTTRRKIIVTSIFEDRRLLSLLENKYTVVYAAGAGYKCLAVAKDSANLYVLSLPNTHFWDTCGPHAILAAQGGGIVNFVKIIQNESANFHKSSYLLAYNKCPKTGISKNTGGIIAYKNVYDLDEFLEYLKTHHYHSYSI